MTTSGISDQTSRDSIKFGEWLFRWRTAIPLPFALTLLLLRVGEAPFSWTLVGAGAVLTGGGEAIRLAAVHHIGVISRTRSTRLGPLITSGPFAIVRNPLYLGNVLLWTGFAVTARLVWAAPVVAALLLLEYHFIVGWEEALLEARYGASYREYAGTVPRWLPSLRNATAPHPARERAAYSWRETFFSERGTLIAIAAGYVLLWLKAALSAARF
jgi:protein-S-isoprenylcysteine O-methyltransferase Ste14